MIFREMQSKLFTGDNADGTKDENSGSKEKA